MGRVKSYYWEEIIAMSHHENEQFEELVREGQEEQDYQDHLAGGEICQSGQCPYCREQEEKINEHP